MNDEDIVRSFLRMMAEEVPTVPAPVVTRLEQRFRLYWGGSRPYVAKAPTVTHPGPRSPRTIRRWKSWPRTQRG